MLSKLHITKFGKGPNLVLLHGWGSSSKIWQPYFEPLSTKYKVWCVDLPGHGDSHAIKWDCSIEQGIELLAQSLPQLCSIIGWSLGGLFAQLFVRQFPQRSTNLMLISSSPKFVEGKTWPHGMRSDVFNTFSHQFIKAPQQTLQKFCALQVLNSKSAKQTLSVLTSALSNQQRHITNIQWGLRWLEEQDLRADTVLNSLPIELLHGDNDKVLSIHAAEQMVNIWGNVKLECVMHAGHAPFVSHPDLFLQWIDSGIKNQ